MRLGPRVRRVPGCFRRFVSGGICSEAWWFGEVEECLSYHRLWCGDGATADGSFVPSEIVFDDECVPGSSNALDEWEAF